jgi:hypothetical protein
VISHASPPDDYGPSIDANIRQLLNAVNPSTARIFMKKSDVKITVSSRISTAVTLPGSAARLTRRYGPPLARRALHVVKQGLTRLSAMT